MKKPIKITGISELLLKVKKGKKAVFKKAAKIKEEPSGEVNLCKVAMIGCGFVGSASWFALMQTALFAEIALINIDKNKIEGEVLDMSHGLHSENQWKLYIFLSQNLYRNLWWPYRGCYYNSNSRSRKSPGETRLILVKKNIKIHRVINAELKKRKINDIILNVANPVDILKSISQKLSGLSPEIVFGSGTHLDTARFKYILGEYLSVDNRPVYAFIIGEHGDREIAV